MSNRLACEAFTFVGIRTADQAAVEHRGLAVFDGDTVVRIGDHFQECAGRRISGDED